MKNKITHDNQMCNLKDELLKILEVLPKNSNIYYFDYPVHDNIGDLLIWHGTEKFFKENNICVKKRFSYHQFLNRNNLYSKLEIPSDIVIVCHGGGNFGDLYIPHQQMRKELVENFPSNKVVFLPRTIHYTDKSLIKLDMELLAQHKDLHFFVRDVISFNIVKEYINKVYLLPDMAHYLYPVQSKKSLSKRQSNTLFFFRRDQERNSNQEILSVDKKREFDWSDLYSYGDKKVLTILHLFHSSSILNKFISDKFLAKTWYIFSGYLIQKAINKYSSFENIVTSRLHGHILACLMNKNNSLIDNSYGKNLNYYKKWTKNVNKAKLM